MRGRERKEEKAMSLIKIAKILGISPTLTCCSTERGRGGGDLKERYEELVNTPEARASMPQVSDGTSVSEKKGGGAGGTRTPDFLRAREALSQLSYSPT